MKIHSVVSEIQHAERCDLPLMHLFHAVYANTQKLALKQIEKKKGLITNEDQLMKKIW
jgi:hypothetical protein